MLTRKLKFLARSVLQAGQNKECPFCGSHELDRIDSKFAVVSLLKCSHCGLNHRHPKDDQRRLEKFYQQEYSINNRMMTKLPSDKEIQTLKEQNFPALRDYDGYIRAVTGKPAKVLDYGCSWGYNVFKLIRAGHDATGYELSRPRAEFGKAKLGVPIHSDTQGLPAGNDIVFSSHVIEHLGDIRTFIDLSRKLLKPDGIFMAFCPNGSDAYRKREPGIWHVNWGDVHPNHLSVEFATQAFKDHPYLVLTGDWQFEPGQLSGWDGVSQVTGTYHAGKELLIISKPNMKKK